MSKHQPNAVSYRVIDPGCFPCALKNEVSSGLLPSRQIVHQAGLNHFGVHVDDMDAAISMFRARGAEVQDSRVSSTHAVLSNILDPNGIRMELSELPPASLHWQAMDRWQ